jgi:hypothetical protein
VSDAPGAVTFAQGDPGAECRESLPKRTKPKAAWFQLFLGTRTRMRDQVYRPGLRSATATTWTQLAFARETDLETPYVDRARREAIAILTISL